ncbi:reverse transcriptase [Corchorus capsularis]|uniref:RNA-directed DNA polymerase n=1 Tax=Corchorus capsularis TaxID=210143 RepID=A0A1R3KDK9_COCAP|nr:reverse transcriptase [Corchorus capsularis]
MQARRAKGLCYNCDDQYKPGHRCRTTPFLLLQTEEDTNDAPDTDSPSVLALASLPLPPPPSDYDDQDTSAFQVSIHALNGSSSCQTMKMTGWLMGHKVRVLIDSGSTHNLIQPRIAKQLGLRLEPAPPFSVMVGNGDRLLCSGKVPSISIGLEGHDFTLDLFLLDIWGADVVLGVQWLVQIGPFIADYKALFMSFYDSYGNYITLHGDKPIQVSPATCQQLRCLIHMDSVASAHLLAISEIENVYDSSTLQVPETLQTLLSKYHSVFAKPQGLPPFRQQSHHIHLQPGASPINVRPYRYPHSQKQDMTNIIEDMLKQGIIRPSVSPFSSLVLLVKKKDGTWRFCVDYRALNTTTIKDRFPIPTVDKLIDELHGAKIFSKLDLRAGYHQIRVAPENIHKTAFTTLDGHYEFLVMSFGLTNAPSTFQATMNDIFRPYLRHFVLVFFDDILVYSSSMEAHYNHLATVLQLLAHNQLYAKLSKCTFGQTSIEYLGHVIGDQGALKAALTSVPVLALSDFSLPFSIEADVSNVAIGAVLTQAGHPVAYFSKKLGPQKQLASTYVRKLYAITEVVHKWHQYLIGRPFTIYIDQQSIKNMMNQTVQTPEQQKWLVKLLGFQYSIEYKPGRQNSAADALSRCYTMQITHMAMTQPILSFLDDLCNFYLTAEQGEQLWAQAAANGGDGLTIADGLLFFKGRVYVPEKHPLRALLLHEFHSSPTGGHAGVKKTLARLAANFHWPNMRHDVESFIKLCATCQQVKYETAKPGGHSTPLPIPSNIWEYCRLHGMPSTIVSDRDPKFLSIFWKELFKLQQTKLFHSSAYHPQSDGQTEVLNRCLETYLRSFVSDKPRLWTKFLHWAEFSYNTSKHSSTGFTPFEVVYGRPPPSILSYLPGASKVAQLDSGLIKRQQILSMLKANLARAQNRMKMQHDLSVSKRPSQKLAKRYFGPFKILRKLGPVAYELELPSEAKIHPVFHVSLLKKCYGSHTDHYAPLPKTFVEDQPVLEPSDILNCRTTMLNGVVTKQYLIQWKDLAAVDATWEWEEDMKVNYPLFNLEDKVVLGEHGNDRPPIRSKSTRLKTQPVRYKDYELDRK